MECLGLAPAGTGEPGRVLERWFREIRLGLSGSLASGLQAGRGWRDLPNSCASRTSVEQRWQTPPDLRSSLLSPLNELKSHGFDTLLQSLFGGLKVVQPPAPRLALSLVLEGLGEGLGGWAAETKSWQEEGVARGSCREAGGPRDGAMARP